MRAKLSARTRARISGRRAQSGEELFIRILCYRHDTAQIAEVMHGDILKFVEESWFLAEWSRFYAAFSL